MRSVILFYSFLITVGAFSPKFYPLNQNQEKFQNLIQSKDKHIIFGIGSAGTGKTLLSCQEAVRLLQKKQIKKIILSRPTVSVEGEELGHLPGSLQEKMSPWTRPLLDNLREFYSMSEIQKLISNDVLEICPLGFMRGRTFKDCFIILDEAQNSTPIQMKMILTRIGFNSKLVINGDLGQSDIQQRNGLKDVIERLSTLYENPHEMYRDGFGIVRFSESLRHPIINKINNLYDYQED
jgi:phosphate starvation-inducible PhoH-like protein